MTIPADRLPGNTSAKSYRLDSLTGLRFVAALFVMILHLRHAAGVAFGSPWIFDAILSVDFFFVLSGFILSHASQGRGFATPGDWLHFFVARFSRIWPLHAVVLGFWVVWAAGEAWGGGGWDSVHFGWMSLGLHLSLLDWLGRSSGLSWNYPAWSVSAEALAYFLFPFLLTVIRRLERRRAFHLLVLFGALFVIFDGSVEMTLRTFNGSWMRITPEFVLGMLLYQASYGISLSSNVTNVLLIGALSCLGVGVAFLAPNALLVILILIVILAVSQSGGGFSKLLGAGVVVRLGEASYSLYLTHALFFEVGYKASRTCLPGIADEHAGLVGIAMIALAILISLAVHALIERPLTLIVRTRLSEWILVVHGLLAHQKVWRR